MNQNKSKSKKCDCPECRADTPKKLSKKEFDKLPAAVLIVEVDWERKNLKNAFKGFRLLCSDEKDKNHGTLFVGNFPFEAILFFTEWLEKFEFPIYRIELDEGIFVFAEATNDWELLELLES